MASALHVTSRGSGEPVLLLHSGGMSSRQWRKLGDKLVDGYRVVTPDFLGAGDNPPWPEGTPFHFHQDVDEVAALVADLGQPVHVVGHSYGGLVALTLARRQPGMIRSLAAFDPVAFGVLHESGDEVGLADLARVGERLMDPAIGGGEVWMEAFVDYWNGAGSWQAMPAPSREAFLRVGRKVFLEVSSLLADRTPAAGYARIAAPVLILTGERSPQAAHRVGALLAAAVPHGRQAVVAGAGHMGPITHAAAVDAAIAAHLAAATTGQTAG